MARIHQVLDRKGPKWLILYLSVIDSKHLVHFKCIPCRVCGRLSLVSRFMGLRHDDGGGVLLQGCWVGSIVHWRTAIAPGCVGLHLLGIDVCLHVHDGAPPKSCHRRRRPGFAEHVGHPEEPRLVARCVPLISGLDAAPIQLILPAGWKDFLCSHIWSGALQLPCQRSHSLATRAPPPSR